MGRILKYGALLILALLIAAGVYVYVQGQTLIQEGVETHGPKLTGGPVAIAGVRVLPWSGNGRISGLEIGNPAGFSQANVLELREIAIDVEPASLFENTIVINSIALREPRLLYEIGKGGSNLKALQKNIAAFAGQPQSDAPAKQVIIHRLLVENPEVVVTSAVGGLSDQSLKLASIELTDIGVGEGGVPPGDAARLAMDAIMPQVTRALASNEGKKLLGKLKEEVVGDKLPDLSGDKALGKELGKGLNKLLQSND
ncbi:MAG: hypothetical protein Tsb0016_14170 [Sphingomonadales bacterium]